MFLGGLTLLKFGKLWSKATSFSRFEFSKHVVLSLYNKKLRELQNLLEK